MSAENRARLSWRASARCVPRAVWALVLLHLSLLLVWSTLVRVFDAPDEPQHVDAILMLRAGEGWPPPGEAALSTQMLEAYEASDFRDPETGVRSLKPVTAEQARPRAERPSFAELGPRQPGPQTNQMTQHPPLYYALGAVALFAAPRSGELAFDQTVAMLRILNVGLIAPLPLLAFAAARRLTGQAGPIAAAAAAGPLAIPMLSHIGSTVNSDNLLTLLIGSLTVALVHVATGDTSARTAAVVGVLASLALLTKGFALFVPPWIALAYLVAGRRTSWRPAMTRLAVALTVPAAAGGWWYARNLIALGALQPRVFDPGPAPPGFAAIVSQWATQFPRWMSQRFWGSFGWAEVSLTWAQVHTASVIAIGGLLAAGALRRRRDRWTRADLAVLLAPLALLAGMVAYGSWTFYAYAGELYGTQGRYLFPAVVGAAVAFALGAGRLLGPAARALPLVVLAGAGALQAIAGRTVARHYYGTDGPTPFIDRLDAVLAWAPWPPPVVIGVWAAAGLAGLWAAVELALLAARRSRA